jgi:isoquinoline 1-oxidoreductase
MKGVLNAAAERFGWSKRPMAAGIACGFEKNGYVATCAAISIASGRVKVERLVTAFDCGAVVNPDHIRNQIEGSMIMAIGGALFERAEFENGKLLTDRLSRYRVPRFSDVPRLETVLLDRKDIPSAGAGETPMIGVAPAIGNAICAATGVRRRHLPLDAGAAS